MKLAKHFSTIFIVIFLYQGAFAQVADPKRAKEYFSNKNYTDAAYIYEALTKKDPSNMEYQLNAGICYLNSNIDKARAVQFLEKATKSANADEESFFYLGLAYQHALRFDEAIKAFNDYKIKKPGDAEKAEKHIKSSKVGKKLVASKLNVEFENLGANINTKYPDYYPFISKDDNQLVFTARKPQNTGGYREFDGYYSSDIWVATKDEDGNWSKARNAGSFVNSDFDEQAVGLSDDGLTMFVYADKIKDFGDIYTSQKTGKSYKQIQKMDNSVNSEDFETAASLSKDGNTLFFASDRSGGQGGLDLYMTRKLPTGEWAQPQNLGAQINTEFDEDFPTLSFDGKTLYFCSEGHENMGGFDIFKSEWDPLKNEWTKPTNIGYPINTPDDERVISFIEDGYHAYISATRPGGLGDLDIYKVSFLDLQPKLLIKLKLPESTPDVPYNLDADVFIYDQMNEQVGSYKANQKTGEYLIILPAGKYNIEIEAPGKEFYTEAIDITMDMVQKMILKKEITLK